MVYWLQSQKTTASYCRSTYTSSYENQPLCPIPIPRMKLILRDIVEINNFIMVALLANSHIFLLTGKYKYYLIAMKMVIQTKLFLFI